MSEHEHSRRPEAKAHRDPAGPMARPQSVVGKTLPGDAALLAAETAGDLLGRDPAAAVEGFLARSSGETLPGAVAADLGRRLGHDVSGVRVHTGTAAAESAASVGAVAYAVGQNVVFGAGQYRPDTDEGRFVLAHELAHTIQQRDSAETLQRKTLELGHETDPAEQTADEAAERALRGGPPGAITRSARKICRFTRPWPLQHASVPPWNAPAFNMVSINPLGWVVPRGGAALAEPFTAPDATMRVPNGTHGEIRLQGSGSYMAAVGGLQEQGPASARFDWYAAWGYQCAADGTLRIEEARFPVSNGGTDYGLNGDPRVSMTFTPSTDGSAHVSEALTFTQGSARMSIGIGRATIGVPGTQTPAGSFVITPRLTLIPATTASAPVAAPGPTPAPPGPTPAPPAPTPAPRPRSGGHAYYLQMGGEGSHEPPDHGAGLQAWVRGLEPELQARIRRGDVVVEVTGYASHTSTLRRDTRHSHARAETVRRLLRQYLGDLVRISESWRNHRDAEGEGPDPDERSVEIRIPGSNIDRALHQEQ